MKTVLRGGRLLDPKNGIDREADVLLEGDRVESVSPDLGHVEEAEVHDVTGQIVVPGLIDMHVHLREPGYEHKETIRTGTRAAVRGGFTTVVCMPNTKPIADDTEVLGYILRKAKEAGYARCFPVAAVTKRSEGQETVDLGGLLNAGAVAFSDDGRPISNSRIMWEALTFSKNTGTPIISHCEDTYLSQGGVVNEGSLMLRLRVKGIPNASEDIMVARDIILAQATGGHVHIAHVSTKGAVDLIRLAKLRGAPITADATPHHFCLSDEIVASLGANAKMNPPLRSEEDVLAIKQGLADGTIDVIASDHAPHTADEKSTGLESAPFGVIGLETTLGIVLRELVYPGFLSLSEAIAKLTVNPARILHLPLGTIAEGAFADITVIDLEQTMRVNVANFESKSRNCPFDDWLLPGRVTMTIVGGKLKARDERVLD